jgi:hypothetical protein
MGKKIHLNFNDLKSAVKETFYWSRYNTLPFLMILDNVANRVYDTSGYKRLTNWEKGYLSCMIENEYNLNQNKYTIWASNLDDKWYVYDRKKIEYRLEVKLPEHFLDLKESNVSWEDINNRGFSAAVWIKPGNKGEVRIYSSMNKIPLTKPTE